MAIECRIVHRLPGRVRIVVTPIEVLRSAEQPVISGLSAVDGLHSVRINRRCGSLTATFQPATGKTEQLVEMLLRCLSPAVAAGARVDRPAPRHEATQWSGKPALVADPLPASNEAALSEGFPAGTQMMVAADKKRQQKVSWHDLPIDDVFRKLQSDPVRGLDRKAVIERLQYSGANRLQPAPPVALGRIFANQFRSLPVALLAGASAISLMTGGVVDAIVILGVVLVNAGIGFVTESHAERTIATLQSDSGQKATAVRDGQRQIIDPESIVPGDLIEITPGSCIPADLRLLTVHRLMVDESSLTGESLPVAKIGDSVVDTDTALRDRCNMAYRSTTVTGGSGSGIVVQTGSGTEAGQIQSLVTLARSPETPLQRQLKDLGRNLGLITGGLCGGVVAAGILRRLGPLVMLKSGSSLAVAAVPEGLPMVATTTLALGIRRMRRLNVAVRRLDAVETLGSVKVICLDKTGTLTRNQMRVVRVFAGNRPWTVDPEGRVVDAAGEVVSHDADRGKNVDLQQLAEVAALCNETAIDDSDPSARALHGSPTETALFHLALNLLDDVRELRSRFPALHTEYRTEQQGYMTTRHAWHSGNQLVAVKGRPDEVLELCCWQMVDGSPLPLDERARAGIRTANEYMAGRGLRVLGLARQITESGKSPDARQLTWLGLCGIADPLRPGMPELMRQFHRAGIRTVMITGDQNATAHAIGRELALSGTSEIRSIDSIELESLDPQVLSGLAANADVFSSVSPMHKLIIVQAMQRGGNVVAMTGDGINDGPALKAADIGVAMGGEGGTDVARMTADVVLEDNNLHTMISAIRQGRTIYSNTRHAIRYLLSTNMSEIMVMVGAMAGGVGPPLTPMQLLWINLVSDIFPVLALAIEGDEPDVLQRAPRDVHEPIFGPDSLREMLAQSAGFCIGALGSHAWGRYRLKSEAAAGTMAFVSLTSAQLLHMLSCRSERSGLFTAGGRSVSPTIAATLAGGLGILLITTWWNPLRRLLGNSPLSASSLAISLSGGLLPYLANEGFKTRKTGILPTVSVPAGVSCQPDDPESLP
jgi:Ca2+-transporting ATPase